MPAEPSGGPRAARTPNVPTASMPTVAMPRPGADRAGDRVAALEPARVGATALGAMVAAPAARPGRTGSAAPRPHGHGERSWSYVGETGPDAWASLRPEYAGCASGRRQSPIDVRDGISVDLEPLRFDYQPGAFSVLDTGHTVQVDVAPGNTLSVGGRRYELKQFHFHRPSEERLEGRGYEMDVHLLHADPEGRLAVVAVLVEGGKAHPLVQQVWNNLPLEPQQPQAAAGPIDPAAVLPEDRRYATYMGSLTTPPCTEGVLWIVLKQPATMSPEQIAIFARLYPMNARPLQAAGGRLFKQSN
jgi:carbonic anhydrase